MKKQLDKINFGVSNTTYYLSNTMKETTKKINEMLGNLDLNRSLINFVPPEQVNIQNDDFKLIQ